MSKRIEELETENRQLHDHLHAALVQLEEQIAENAKLRERLIKIGIKMLDEMEHNDE